MDKRVFALLPFALTIVGCALPVDSVPADEDTASAEDELTSFFSTGEGDYNFCPDGKPIVKSPSMSNGNVFLGAAGSCASMPGATLKLQVPWSVTTYGPYPLTWDSSGTLLKAANVGPSAFPAGSCRILTIKNTNGQVSNQYSYCR